MPGQRTDDSDNGAIEQKYKREDAKRTQLGVNHPEYDCGEPLLHHKTEILMQGKGFYGWNSVLKHVSTAVEQKPEVVVQMQH